METTDDVSGGVIKAWSGIAGESPALINPGQVTGTEPRLIISSGSAPAGPQACVLHLDCGTGAGTLSVGGNLSVSNQMFCNDLIESNANGLFMLDLAGGGTTGASINNNGRVIRTPSSRRYKSNVKKLRLDDARKVLDLEPVTFTLRDEAKAENRRTYPGFIAEQAAEVGADLWVNRDAEGRPDGFRYAELTAALVLLVREQQAAISRLDARVEQLTDVAGSRWVIVILGRLMQ
jgi:hypothetical protein